MRGIAHQPAIPHVPRTLQAEARVSRRLSDVQGLAQLVGMKKIEGPADHRSSSSSATCGIRQLRLLLHPLQVHRQARRGRQLRGEAQSDRRLRRRAAHPLLQKRPDVLAITGDHSTPCALKGHSWHPQPVLAQVSAVSGSDKLERFTETGANWDRSAVFEAKYLMRYMQANAKMFDKFGA
jgi:2,3-bisphosphoglycerate-independent phosphoglycerate mutase